MIKGSIGRDYNADETDVLITKKALKRLGYYKTPAYGLTPYADEKLFHAISSFQKDRGLNPSGSIKKDDATAILLAKAYMEQDDGVGGADDQENSPIFRCVQCGAPHGGSQGDLCPDCASKA